MSFFFFSTCQFSSFQFYTPLPLSNSSLSSLTYCFFLSFFTLHPLLISRFSPVGGDPSQQRFGGSASTSALDRFDSRLDSIRGGGHGGGGGGVQRSLLPSSSGGGASSLGDSSLDSVDVQLGADGRRKRGPKKNSSAFPLKRGRFSPGLKLYRYETLKWPIAGRELRAACF